MSQATFCMYPIFGCSPVASELTPLWSAQEHINPGAGKAPEETAEVDDERIRLELPPEDEGRKPHADEAEEEHPSEPLPPCLMEELPDLRMCLFHFITGSFIILLNIF